MRGGKSDRHDGLFFASNAGRRSSLWVSSVTCPWIWPWRYEAAWSDRDAAHGLLQTCACTALVLRRTRIRSDCLRSPTSQRI